MPPIHPSQPLSGPLKAQQGLGVGLCLACGAAGMPSLFTHQFQAEPCRCSRWVASIIERVDLGCASNPMLAIISLTAALPELYFVQKVLPHLNALALGTWRQKVAWRLKVELHSRLHLRHYLNWMASFICLPTIQTQKVMQSGIFTPVNNKNKGLKPRFWACFPIWYKRIRVLVWGL